MNIIGFMLMLIAALAVPLPVATATVSSPSTSCIAGAMDSIMAALSNRAQLNRLYDRYFAEEKIAQLAAGKDWKAYNSSQKNDQRKRVRQFLMQLAPKLSGFKGSKVKFLSESGSQVRGVLSTPNGQRRTITWYFAGGCKFSNISVEGYGSLISFVGKQPEN